MGCGFSDEDWQTRLECAEQEVFAAVPGLVMGQLRSFYALFRMYGEDYAVRCHVYNDDRSKKTLVLTHGYCLSAVLYSQMLPALAKHYRIVMFDNLGFGLNRRVQDLGDALESPEKAERWLISWWEHLIEALEPELPAKFYLTGHSAGGFQCMLYSSVHPERIDGLFLQSPVGSEDQTRPSWVYDPYTIRTQDQTDDLPKRSEVDAGIANYAANVHLVATLHKMPHWMVKAAMGSEFKKMCSPRFFS